MKANVPGKPSGSVALDQVLPRAPVQDLQHARGVVTDLDGDVGGGIQPAQQPGG